MAVQTASIAVADGASAHDAHGIDRGTLGPRPADSDHRIRHLHATAKHRGFVDDAGPCGCGLSRDLRKPGSVGGGVAPAWPPQKAGDRVQTDRREAGPWAR
jgi:transposase